MERSPHRRDTTRRRIDAGPPPPPYAEAAAHGSRPFGAARETVDVLIIEDDHDISEMMLFWLSGHGLTTLVADNGERARALLLSGVQPRVILLDLMMPVMDGYMFSAWQARDPASAAIPVIVISAIGPGNPPLTLPPAARIDKPVDLDHTLAVIRTVVDHGRTARQE